MKRFTDSFLIVLLFATCIVFYIPLAILCIIDEIREDHFYDQYRKTEIEKAEYYHHLL